MTLLESELHSLSASLAELYGLSGSLTALPSYKDLNFCLEDSKQEKWVIKLSSPDTPSTDIALENEIMKHLAQKHLAQKHLAQPAPPFLYPKLRSGLNGDIQYELKFADQTYQLRVITWLEGRLYSDTNTQQRRLKFSLGQLVGATSLHLQDFHSHNAQRKLDWDINQLARLKPLLENYSGEQRAQLETCFKTFSSQIAPVLNELPKQVIHNDANDQNIMTRCIKNEDQCTGLFDFGDAIYTSRVNDLAIAMTYALFNQGNLVETFKDIYAGYSQYVTLNELEKSILFELIQSRLLQSLLKSAQSYKANPSNTYILVSAKPAWTLLQALSDLGNKPFMSAINE